MEWKFKRLSKYVYNAYIIQTKTEKLNEEYAKKKWFSTT